MKYSFLVTLFLFLTNVIAKPDLSAVKCVPVKCSQSEPYYCQKINPFCTDTGVVCVNVWNSLDDLGLFGDDNVAHPCTLMENNPNECQVTKCLPTPTPTQAPTKVNNDEIYSVLGLLGIPAILAFTIVKCGINTSKCCQRKCTCCTSRFPCLRTRIRQVKYNPPDLNPVAMIGYPVRDDSNGSLELSEVSHLSSYHTARNADATSVEINCQSQCERNPNDTLELSCV